jgi:hemerythrin-like domain-containing protein
MALYGNPYSKTTFDWAQRSLMVPHTVIRLYTEKFVEGLEGVVKMQDQGRVVPFAVADSLVEWFVHYYYYFVEQHDSIQSNIFVPWLDSRLLDNNDRIPTRFAVQHHRLCTKLEKLKDSMGSFRDGCLSGSVAAQQQSEILSQLFRDVKAYALDLGEHLDEKEQVVVPLIRAAVTEEEMSTKLAEIVQGLGLEGAKIMVPWILESLQHYDTTPRKEHANSYYYTIPAFLRFMNWVSWSSAHITNNKAVIEALANGETPARVGWC